MINLGGFLGIKTVTRTEQKKLCIHMDNSLAVFEISAYLSQALQDLDKKGAPIIMCIGTDRSTGDSLGPLTGWQLTTLLKHWDLPIYGTLDNPIHAVNLAETIQSLLPMQKDCPIIAVDACLGQVSPVGSIVTQKESLQPGIGLKKNLPAVGDISISGIVNVGGYMEFQVLQNTRLNLVVRMAQTIANSIFLAIQKNYPHLRKGVNREP